MTWDWMLLAYGAHVTAAAFYLLSSRITCRERRRYHALALQLERELVTHALEVHRWRDATGYPRKDPPRA